MNFIATITLILCINITSYSSEQKSKEAEERLRGNQERYGGAATSALSSGPQNADVFSEDDADQKIRSDLNSILMPLMGGEVPTAVLVLIIKYLSGIQLSQPEKISRNIFSEYNPSQATALAFSKDNRFVATATARLIWETDFHRIGQFLEGDSVDIIDVVSHKKVCTFDPEGYLIRALGFCSAGKKLFAVTNSNILIGNVSAGRFLQSFKTGVHHENASIACNSSDVLVATLSHNGDLPEPRNETHIWKVTSQEITRLQTIMHCGEAIAFSHGGELIAVSTSQNRIRIIPIKQSEYTELEGHSLVTPPISSLTFSSDNRFLLSTNLDHTAKVWHIESGRSLNLFHGDDFRVKSAVFHPFLPFYITAGSRAAGQNEIVSVWRFQDDEIILQPYSFKGVMPISCMASTSFIISSDARHLVLGSSGWCERTSLRLWHLKDPYAQAILPARRGSDAAHAKEKRRTKRDNREISCGMHQS